MCPDKKKRQNDMKKCLIVSGGEFEKIEGNAVYDLIIACDRGYERCVKNGIVPDVVIGDFDSYGGKIDDKIEVIKLNPIKDDTDTMSAVRYAIDNGCKEIRICCAFGGRFDHSMANIQTASFILENGAAPIITGKDTIVYGIKNSEITLPKKEDCYISFFALSDVCEGVTIKGTKYLMDNGVITNTFPIGVSNEWTGDEAHIAVKSGTAVIIISKFM